MLFFFVFGKFGAVAATIPLPIVAAAYCVLFAYVATSVGLGFLKFCNLNSNRSMVIVGFSLFIGLSVPQYFNEYMALSRHGITHIGPSSFNNIMQVIFSYPTTVPIIIAYLLDSTMSLEKCTYMLYFTLGVHDLRSQLGIIPQEPVIFEGDGRLHYEYFPESVTMLSGISADFLVELDFSGFNWS
ncbi:unnamed protein product [Vicia faba]|uniref:Uncharacterized protein n=1 Tax=Vicia faba TaxID=3906 RepID=A0AAV1A3W4_VICFA|nr:unnamed protein product [Vicia faba]